MSNASKAVSKAKFPQTRWSLVLDAREDGKAETALEELCRLYWPPLYAFIRRSGWSEQDAEDLCQEFLMRVIERRQLDKADRKHGKLRSYLLAYLKHFLSDKRKIANAKKRGGHREIVSIDQAEAESRYLSELADADTPETAFEKTWILTLLDAVLQGLGETYRADCKEALFSALKPTLQWGDTAKELKEIANDLGMKEGAVKVAAHRLRKRYQQALRQQIENTLAEGENVDDEIRALFDALST